MFIIEKSVYWKYLHRMSGQTVEHYASIHALNPINEDLMSCIFKYIQSSNAVLYISILGI